MGTTGDEKDTSVQFTVIAIWSFFPGSSRPKFINMDFRRLFIVFAEVCTIISAGIQGTNDQIENAHREGDSYFSTRDGSNPQTCRKLGKCEVHLQRNLLNNSCPSTSVQFFNFFFRVFGKVVDLTRSIMETRIVVKNLWNSMLNVNLYAYLMSTWISCNRTIM